MDILWLTLCSFLVFSMQAGFLCLEAGLSRSKNSINVAIKNLLDVGIAVMAYWVLGFAFMFGPSLAGWIGGSGFLLDPEPADQYTRVFFLYQAMFCSTAVTILSGAVAERMRFGVYCLSALVISALIYPVAGHWAWGGALTGEVGGWLAKLGFRDFAGSTVVHSVGGWVALAALLHIGARTGRFPADGSSRPIPGSNIPLAVLGCLILMVGWFGFNGGSTYAFTPEVPRVIINTLFGISAGIVVMVLYSLTLRQRVEVSSAINSCLAGAVAITASCNAVSLPEAALIGAIGGLIAIWGEQLLEKLRLDDAVGAIPVHLMAGIWGTLAVGIFGDLEAMGVTGTRLQTIQAQLIGIAAIGAWAFAIAWIFFSILGKFTPLRVTAEAELEGLNVAEHGARTETVEFADFLRKQASTGDLSLRVPEEPFTEIGLLARAYNHTMDQLERNQAQYSALFESTKEGILIADRDSTQLRAVNPAARAMLGIKDGELYKAFPLAEIMRLEEADPPVEGNSLALLLRESAHSGTRRGAIFRTAEGHRLPTMLFASKHSVQGQSFYTITLTDMRPEVEARRDLVLAREGREALMRSVHEGVFIVDQNGLVSRFNDAAQRLFALDGEADPGTAFWDLLFPAQLRDRVRYGIARLIANARDPILGKTISSVCQQKGGEDMRVELVFQRIQVERQVFLIVLARSLGAESLVRGRDFDALPF